MVVPVQTVVAVTCFAVTSFAVTCAISAIEAVNAGRSGDSTGVAALLSAPWLRQCACGLVNQSHTRSIIC